MPVGPSGFTREKPRFIRSAQRFAHQIKHQSNQALEKARSPNTDQHASGIIASEEIALLHGANDGTTQMRFHIENIRGFSGNHHLDIRPITLLVGDNSSGKTTLLASLFATLQADFPVPGTLNRAPFELGGFETTATYRGGRSGRALSFSLGWEEEIREPTRVMRASFINHLGIPRVNEIELSYGNLSLKGNVSTRHFELIEKQQGARRYYKFALPEGVEPRTFALSDIARLYIRAATSRIKNAKDFESVIDALFQLERDAARGRPRVTALAPLRTRPHRTYDKLIEEFKPEGDHIPLVLARILVDEADKKEQPLTKALEDFGQDSGLFKKITVRRMGRSPSDPFQLRVKSAGPDVNLVDVGYGVSQALPIVVDSILAPKNSVVLVQQPEVHLHPRAQAALGRFFCALAVADNKRFVIETHSDYLVDRSRMAVANGVIPAGDVTIAFLERKGLDVQIHQLRLDAMGNVMSSPPAYRAFFLEEEIRLLMGKI